MSNRDEEKIGLNDNSNESEPLNKPGLDDESPGSWQDWDKEREHISFSLREPNPLEIKREVCKQMTLKENDSLQDQLLALNLQLDECHPRFWYSGPRVRC
jgi:hypothetical protein